MESRTLILIATLLAAVLSGCISAKDDVDPETGNEAAPEDASTEGPDDVDLPERTDADIYQYTWVGQRALDQRFTVDQGYDHLFATFTHTGQMFGHPILEVGNGDELDDTFTSLTGGTFHVSRVVPPAPGEGRLTMAAGPALDGHVAGVGGFTLRGYTGYVPDELLHLTWTGQRADPVILDSQVQFYVPATVERFEITLSGTGQTTNGFRLLDPDGEEMYTYGANSGPMHDRSTFQGKEGLWTVVLEGSTNGPWTFDANTIQPTPDAAHR